MLDVATPRAETYALGHSEQELQRLIRQSRFFNEFTRSVLGQAGMSEGMHVLDVGCGAGDVSFLAAEIVGPRGSVIGVDRSEEAVAVAASRAHDAGLVNVTFLTRDIGDLELEQPVGAIVGRLVLMYLPDPATVLRRLAALVKPGGVVVFQEIDMAGATSEPTCPVFETAVQRIRDAFDRAGADKRAGLKLQRIFREAGLPAPRMVLGARVESGPDSPIYRQVADVTRSLQPLMLAAGLATVDEIDVETLADRIREEVLERDATLVSPSLIGAWTRKPGTDPEGR